MNLLVNLIKSYDKNNYSIFNACASGRVDFIQHIDDNLAKPKSSFA